MDSLAKATTSCGSWDGQNSVIDLNGLTWRSVTQCRPFQLPQSLVILSEVSKIYSLVNLNHIPLQFRNNTDIEIEK